MGTWDVDAFGNDTAADWAWSLDGVSDFSVVGETLDRVLAAHNEELDAPTAEEGVAAAEAVARALGKVDSPNAYTESVDKWVSRLSAPPEPALIAKASAVVDRVVTSPSELLDLWQETEDKVRWEQYMAELKTRLMA